jgi:2-hydroxychromene-2-carboxylate isomerase
MRTLAFPRVSPLKNYERKYIKMSQIFPAGTKAPDFTLHVTPDQTVSLSELRGRPVTLATQNGLDAKAMAEALKQHTFQKRVKKDFMRGVRSGVNGTPAFFINGILFDGEANFKTLGAGIEAVR